MRHTRARLASLALGVGLLAATLTACGAGARPTPSPTRGAAAVPAAGSQPSGAPVAAGITRKQYSAAPPMTIDANQSYTATIKTNLGDIKIELNAKEAPLSVNNFVFLAREGFYNGTVFHRTVPNFIIQGGDPKGDGSGGPGYKFADEPVKGAYDSGSVAMANSGPNTNGSQFFICDGDGCKKGLTPNYNLFGKVVAGQEIVTKIATAPATAPPGSIDSQPSKPVTPVVITTVEIAEQ